ncbi:MAG: SH3 domain-containing protein [Chloroflexota bacterium]|jgi:hypothetical protein
MKTKRLVNLLWIIGLLSACSGGGTGTTPVPPAQEPINSNSYEVFENPLEKGKFRIADDCNYGESCVGTDPYHTGIDLWGIPEQTEVKDRQSVFSSGSGYVVSIVYNDVGCNPDIGGNCDDHGLGNTVIIKHVLADGKTPIYTLYAHLEKIDPDLEKKYKSVPQGTLCVNKATVLGIMGASGYGDPNKWTTTKIPTPHLHLEFKNSGILGNPTKVGTVGINGKFGYVTSNPDDWGYRNPYDYIDKKSALTCYELTKSAQNPTAVSFSTPTPPIPVPGATPIRGQPLFTFAFGDYLIYSNDNGVLSKTKFLGEETIGGYNTWVIEYPTDTSKYSQVTTVWVDQNTGISIKEQLQGVYTNPEMFVTNGQKYYGVEYGFSVVYNFDENVWEGERFGVDTTGKLYKEPFKLHRDLNFDLVTRSLQLGEWYPGGAIQYNHQVVSEEIVSVPAGTFDCWVIRVQGYQEQILYFDKSTGVIIKAESWETNQHGERKLASRGYLVLFNLSNWKANQSPLSLSLPTLNRAEYFSVLQWIKYASLYNDISVFEKLIVGNSIQLIDGNGKTVTIGKTDFLAELSKRLLNKPNCDFFMFEESGRLVIRMSNWSPGWGVDGNTILYLILEMKNNQWVLTSIIYGDYLPSWAQGLERISYDTISLSAGTTTGAVCKEARPTRLKIGDFAFVSFYPPLRQRVRSGPGTSNSILDVIPVGSAVKILDGPQCADNWVWWKVRVLSSKLEGWTAEGDRDAYWLIPCESRENCGTR